MKNTLEPLHLSTWKTKCGLLAQAVMVSGLLVLIAGYGLRLPRLYQSTGVLQLSTRSDDTEPMGIDGYVAVIRSADTVRKVIKRFSGADKATFFQAYGYDLTTKDQVAERLLLRNLSVTSDPAHLIIRIQYRHPDRQLAARIADMFIDEIIAYENRRRIDQSMLAVEALKKTADHQEVEVNRLAAVMTAYREAHPDAAASQLEADGEYPKLAYRWQTAKSTWDSMIQKMRESSMSCGPETPPCRVMLRPVPADEDDWHLQPTGRVLILTGIAMLSAGLLAFLVLKGALEWRAHQGRWWQKSLRAFLSIFSGRVHKYELLLFVLVFEWFFIGAYEHAFAQPRIYRSSVTLAVADDAKDYGWDDLKASDFPSWLPSVILNVASNYGLGARRALLKPYGLSDQGQSDVERVLSNHCSTVYHPDSKTVDVVYQHPDFLVADEVVGLLGQAYEAYPPFLEFGDRSFNRRFEKRVHLLESSRKEVVEKERRRDELKSAITQYQGLHKSTWEVAKYNEPYRTWVREWNRTQAELEVLQRNIRDLTMSSGLEPSPVRIVKSSRGGSTRDYLVAPIVLSLLRGGVVAMLGGVTAVLAVRCIRWRLGR